MFKFLFTVLLIFFLGYYLLKAIYRLLSVFFVNSNSPGSNKYHSREGNITIENKEPSKKRFNKDSGEYVDYEEIK